jgi:FdhE protein
VLTARARLLTYWKGDVTARDDYLSRAILRPYAEVLRSRGATLDRLHSPGHCPFCGGAPMISTRREIPDAAEAAMRMLHCGLCGLEWKFNRACCPACSEEKPDKLPVYKSDAHPAVRIEACETCGRYLKSIDLTLDARPIAEVDDVVSLSMDLWAIDEGLTRIEPGLAGV